MIIENLMSEVLFQRTCHKELFVYDYRESYGGVHRRGVIKNYLFMIMENLIGTSL